MATIRDIATEANVSIATVSRVMNETPGVSPDLRDRVNRVLERLGHHAARKPAGQFIALAYTGRSSLGSPYDTAILEAMSVVASDQGLDLAIVRLENERRGDETIAQVLARKSIRGVVLRTHADTRQTCVDLAREGFPHIVVGERFEEGFVNTISTDSRSTTYQAVEHLISLGHRRIAIALSHVVDTDHADRVAGYTQALADHDLPLDEKLVYRVWAKQPNGEQVIRNLMGLADRPTALFIGDPFVAVGAVNHAHSMGVRIPEDVSIIGFDDADVRSMVYPPLSAVCQDAYRLGQEAVKALIRCMADRDTPPVKVVLPTLLELHRTTGPVPPHRVRILPDGTRIENGALEYTSVKDTATPVA